MARVRMFHAASNRYQYDAAANFEAFHQPEGWVIVDEEPEAPAPVAAAVEPDPEPEAVGAEAPKRARAK